MNNILVNRHAKNDEKEKKAEEVAQRSPVFLKTLTPVVWLLKAFGLYYSLQANSTNKAGEWILARIYCSFVLLILTADLGRTIAGFFFLEDGDHPFVSVLTLSFIVKCVLQMLACRQLSPLYSPCRVEIFLNNLEKYLNEIKIPDCLVQEKKFIRKIKFWIYSFILSLFFIIACQIGIIVNYVYTTDINPSNDTEFNQVFKFQKQTLKPLSMKVYYMGLILFVHIFSYAAWFLPVAMCGILSQCLTYTYSEFYRFFETEKSKGVMDNCLCVKTYMSKVRSHCIKLSSFVKELDDIVKYIFLVSFPLDIVIICINLQLAIFTYTEILARLYIALWTFNPIFTLVAISLYSAQVADKGEKMNDIVQSFTVKQVDLDIQVEVQLLLFHLQTQPPVMTVYGMIPLYKSIIISIFVSVATYFSLIIAF